MLARTIPVCVFVSWAAGLTLCGATDAQSRPAPAEVKVRRVSFTTDDNLVIFAGYTPAKDSNEKAPVAILLHMYRSDRSAFGALPAHLHRAGFAVLAVDLRGHGESVGIPEMGLARRVADRDKSLFAAMDRDVEAAYHWIVEQPGIDPSRIALVGASVGSSVALDYAARDKSVDAVVCLTPGTAYLGLDSISAVEKYGKRPLLLIAAEPEKAASEQLARIGGQSRVRIYPAAGGDLLALHGTRMLGKVPGLEKEITDFLLGAIGPPSREMVLASLKGQVYYAPGASMASKLSKRNVRWFSSPAEAEQRGLRAPRSSSRSRSRSLRAQPAAEGEPFPETPDP